MIIHEWHQTCACKEAVTTQMLTLPHFIQGDLHKAQIKANLHIHRKVECDSLESGGWQNEQRGPKRREQITIVSSYQCDLKPVQRCCPIFGSNEVETTVISVRPRQTTRLCTCTCMTLTPKLGAQMGGLSLDLFQERGRTNLFQHSLLYLLKLPL